MMVRRQIIAALAVAQLFAVSNLTPVHAQKQHLQRVGFFHRLPYAAAAAAGALTGGVGKVLPGGTLFGGAAAGDGTHVGFHWLKQN